MKLTLRNPVTTPIKARKPPALSRKEMEHKELPELKPSTAFCSRRLATHPDLDKLAKSTEIVAAAEAFASATRTSYDLLAALMNAISDSIHAATPDREKIVFKRLENAKPLNHPNDYFSSRPDIVAILQSISDALEASQLTPSWHHIISAFEEKTLSDYRDGPTQCATYLGLLNQARPDLVTVLGVAISPLGYVIQCSNPSGMDSSKVFAWKELKPLISYVYTLYDPAEPHLHFDTTVRLSRGVSIDAAPRWDVTSGGTTYVGCEVRMVGDPWHRMSWVVVSPSDPPYIIKDSYPSRDSSFGEGELYDTLHDAGFVLGFADVVNYHEVESHGFAITVEADGYTRTKTRIVLATSGDVLYKCPTVVTFINIMYDVLEAHRFAVKNRNILHRDISIGNILINPKQARDIQNIYKGADRPKFISEVFSGKYSESLALIIDLDNAAPYNRIADSHDDPSSVNAQDQQEAQDLSQEDSLDLAHERTGTPKYIARSVAVGRVLFEQIPTLQLPTLSGDALAAYKAAYENSGDSLRFLEDDEETIHGSHYDQTKSRRYKKNIPLARADYRHEPRHDAESVFWCILAFLLRSLPKNAKKDVNNEGFNDFWRCLSNHEIDKFNRLDSRKEVFFPIEWAEILHEDLAPLADLIVELVDQVQPEYALLEPSPDICHLHEALQRILFKYSHQFRAAEFDVALNTQRARSTEQTIAVPTQPQSHHTANGQQPHKSATRTKDKDKPKMAPVAGPSTSQSTTRNTTKPKTSAMISMTTRSMSKSLKRAAQAMEMPEVSNEKRHRNK
ncbi:hypothetical protein ONZ45_g3491 [Pleurotus djamor]|nr:hypothetical protein ONZ45_g3491 [Pleurotus djamor]